MYPQAPPRRRSAYGAPRRKPGCGPRAGIALVMMVGALIAFYGNSQQNPVTGETQRVALNVDQEVALGLQAAPEMAAQYGGAETGTQAAALVRQVGARLVNRTEARTSPYKFNFHLLKDQETINAFALPCGQIFITRALLNRLETEGQLAGVLGHEIGHVIQRHSAEHMARAGLTQGMVNAASVATDGQAGQMAAMIGQTINMRYGRDDELESDRSGLRYMYEAGYDPRALIGVMKILDEASGGGPPEFLSSHPKPANRIQHIQQLIDEQWPGGLPTGLVP